MDTQKVSPASVIKSLGLVFGDIGTSPIYTLAVIFMMTERTEANFIGILSLIIWTLILLVTVEYAWLAMSLSKAGEGGTIVLLSILRPMLQSGKKIGFASVLAFIGVSLLVGDGVITPAITILSAVEGLVLLPGLEDVSQNMIVALALFVAIFLFTIQKNGSSRLSAFFGPVMVVWFGVLACSGVAAISQFPAVFKAINPWYGIDFMLRNGLAGFFVLSEVILCATGGEALYADMGHMGRKPILAAWGLVFTALMLCYMGQTAFLVHHPDASNVLFEMVHSQVSWLYAPFLVLSLLATIIASQSLISGIFSIMYQSMATHVMPLFKVDYTSKEMHSQIYIGSVNWALFIAVVLVIMGFKESHHLAAAYGLAVTGSMTITSMLMVMIFHLKNRPWLCATAAGICVLDVIYLVANFYKLPHGGYWSLVIAMIPLGIILIYTQGQKAVYQRMKPMPRHVFMEKYIKLRKQRHTIKGTAIFFLRSLDSISPYIYKTMFDNGIIYERNIMLSIARTYEPQGLECHFEDTQVQGLRVFTVTAGYMEYIDIDGLLEKAGIKPRAIFYGVEDIFTRSLVWKVYAVIKKLAPPFVQFYKLPLHSVHGVVSRISL